jgi:glucose-6-phosphate 1-epimerase
MKLTLTLKATNTDKRPFFVTEGFHPYFRVKDRDQTEVLGVDGCEFTETNAPGKGVRTWTGAYAVRTGGSKLFDVTKREHVLMDNGLRRAIALVSRGNKRLVVWNPGEESAGRVEEFGEDGWRRFVCVEPATTGRDVGYELKPGETHELIMAVQSVPDCGERA